MIAIKALLVHLNRPEVTEVAVTSGKAPCVRMGNALEPLDASTLSTDDILQLLFTAGGSRHVDLLGPKPSQWATHIETVGPIAVSATMTGDVLKARFTLRPRESLTQRPEPLRRSSPRDEMLVPPAPAPPRMLTSTSFEQEVITKPRIVPVPLEAPPLAAPPPKPSSSTERLGSNEASFDFDLDDEPQPPRRAEPAPAPLPTRGTERPPRIDAMAASEALLPPPTRQRKVTLDAPFAEEEPLPTIPTPNPAVIPTVSRSAVTAQDHPEIRLSLRENDVRLFREMLHVARELKASDVHLVAARRPLFRIAGELSPKGDPLDPGELERIMRSRVPPRLLPLLERDGSCDFSLEEPALGRFRVNVARQRTGLKIALRLIAVEIPTLSSLALPESIALGVRHHQGLIVLTGPTGHGKTTTLSALIDILNRETTRHVITIEDPVEYVHPRRKAMMSQREVGTHTRSFQTALRAALREDPDVIVIGELRDAETVRIALTASETGHLVLGTMSTPSAARAIDRLIDLFPPGDQAQVRTTLAGTLRLIVGQRLLPSADRTSLVAAAEVLPGSVPLWNLIRDNKTFQIPSLQQRGRGLGIVRLDESLATLVRENRTTLDAALAIAEAPAELEAVLAGKKIATVAPPPPESGLLQEGVGAQDSSLLGLIGKAGARFSKKGG